MKFGKIGFRIGLCKGMSLDKFSQLYGSRLKQQGFDVEEAYQQLGGKLPKHEEEKPKKRSKKQDSDGVREID